MGYTHYWEIRRDGDQREWSNAIARAIPPILEAATCPLEVVYGDHEIIINGKGPCDGGRNHCDGKSEYCNDENGAQHEPFCIPTVLSAMSSSRNFCKTAQKAYDIPVSAILAALAAYAPNVIKVTSDGGEWDWEEGLALARRALNDDSIALPESVAVAA